MQQLTNKRILLGITGGIAAYKSAELVRHLKKAGADVRVVMTKGAMEFITPLTLQALSGNPVHHALLDPEAEAGMGHIELAKWADLLLVAPASANFLARLSQGLGDDLLTTICLATEAPLAIAPAMNQAMWKDGTTQQNLQRLIDIKGKNFHVFGPDAGEQACGDVGPGRMLDPEVIAASCADLFETGLLAGINLVVTAGPTREAIDPVRYISNHSSGKMGYAIAEAARDAGARVTLISGPVNLPAPERITLKQINSARDMLDEALAQMGECQVFIAAAAVADYRPLTVANQKIKKSGDQIDITMIKNPDVVATVAHHEQRPFTVGFAAETQAVEDYARGKLTNKNLDMIVANDVSREDIGFNSDNNAATAIWQEGQQSFDSMSKHTMARQLIELIAMRYQESQQHPAG
ncbi:bifunctional phosphopantothenoylcysteine decarboxylase/phosphopantothenate--cysteine ligase CoaBC [Bacterioplanoides sp. SCSIO 12839]|uniref:bifunctional phosphopantothenoylcysteine decarboxylase/phosphopantothenate--cysteine ligase CoaBC n=1 Tax=Bacterioplanoides sp. SCSIO 12839 TaxID=2829569 RepID=UPI0021054213|nr:bifunctional phosphopantothenoylcysteine decarboxylase/phosphopantothenate--cysteine ligase CoaBC [Bacterioplanoides sp. SCSIO 12839]UTW50010.1 bifunctional phosphopantothenoylcysteine decarboxylase/phosphopantothenate--cysteine ligase CoaBC [Bacterioplanoides sp. SCSIO 12839]